jgi:hypothetical protein
MATDANTAIVRRFYNEVWNRGNLAVGDVYVRHDLCPSTAPSGPAGQQAVAGRCRTTCPDVHLAVELLVAEGAYVVARWTMAGSLCWPSAPSVGITRLADRPGAGHRGPGAHQYSPAVPLGRFLPPARRGPTDAPCAPRRAPSWRASRSRRQLSSLMSAAWERGLVRARRR